MQTDWTDLPGFVWLKEPPYPHTEEELMHWFGLSDSVCCSYCHERNESARIVWPDGTSAHACCGVACAIFHLTMTKEDRRSECG